MMRLFVLTSLMMLAAISFLPSAAEAEAPGFDCRTADLPSERTVCADPRLAKLDGELAVAYAQLRVSLPRLDADQLLLDQRQWVATRNACTTDSACLTKTYSQRLSTLRNSLRVRATPASEARSNTLSGPSFDCKTVQRASEAAICKDQTLAMLDLELASTFESSISKLAGTPQERLRSEQRQFIRTRNECEANTSCLGQVMQQRMTELKSKNTQSTPTTSLPRSCEEIRAALQLSIPGLKITVDSPPSVETGSGFAVSWQRPAQFPNDTPVYIVFTMPDEMRIEAVNETVRVPSPVKGKPDQIKQRPVTGYIALLKAASNPHSLTYGADRTRILVPLHQNSGTSGKFVVRPYRAGSWNIGWAVVAATACGEQRLVSGADRSIIITPGTPKIVIQDHYSIEKPDKEILSVSRGYLLHVFKARYRVYDTLTGALVLERAGVQPNFSPTSRFLTARSESSGTWDSTDKDTYEGNVEIADLTTGEIIHTSRSAVIGWQYGDTFIVLGEDNYATTTVLASLVSTSDRRRLVQVAEQFGMGHHIASWDVTSFKIDIDNGLVKFDKSPASADTYFIASGIKAFETKENEAEVNTLPSWSALDVSYFKSVYPNPFRLGYFGVEQWREPSKGSPYSLGAESKQTEWRSSARLVSAPGRATMDLSQSTFNRYVQPEVRHVLNHYKIVDQNQLWKKLPIVSARKKHEVLNWAWVRDLLRLRFDLVSNNIAVSKSLGFPEGKYTADELQHDNPDGNKKIPLHRAIAAWKWGYKGRNYALLQLHSIEGTDHFGYGAIALFGADPSRLPMFLTGTAGRKFWEGQYSQGQESDQTKLVVSVAGRYLLLGSIPARKIAVYDLDSNRLVQVLEDVPWIDLLKDLDFVPSANLLLQTNNDGQIFFHSIASGQRVLSGRFVDDEAILYTPNGYYWSTYEGASFVNLQFPGRRGLQTLQQYGSVLNRPDVIRNILDGKPTGAPPPKLDPPPEVAIEPASNKAGRLTTKATATTALRELRGYVDGRPFKTFKLSGADASITINPAEIAGARQLTLQAVDEHGTVSAPASMKVPGAPARHGRLFGVFVGVDEYVDAGMTKLNFAVSDARLAQRAFEQAAKYSYTGSKLEVLANRDASPATIRAAITRVAMEATADDTFVFFFSGHGVQLPDKASGQSQYYLGTTQLSLIEPSGTGLKWSNISEALGAVKARVVVFLDACQSGSAGAELTSNDMAVADLLKASDRPILIFAASKGRESSVESSKAGGGYFTTTLARILTTDRKRYDTNRDDVLQISELYKALRGEVSTRVHDEHSTSQSPWLARRDMLGDFGLF